MRKANDMYELMREREHLQEEIRKATGRKREVEWKVADKLMLMGRADLLKVDWTGMERAINRGDFEDRSKPVKLK